jgi:hypothetical protein
MEQHTVKSVYLLSDSLENGKSTIAAEASLKIISDLAEMIVKGDFENAISIKRLLDDETISMEVTDYPNYTLGRVHAVIEFMNFITLFKEKKLNKNSGAE